MSDVYNNFENRFITLADLKLPDLPKELEFDGSNFVIKPEFHITLINIERIAKIIDNAKLEKLKAGIAKTFYDFTGKQPLTKYELNDDLRLINVDGNKTIVVMAKLQGIDRFFDTLSQKYAVELPVQPTHVTLYTLPADTFGIPINSYDELARISKPLELPELQKLL